MGKEACLGQYGSKPGSRNNSRRQIKENFISFSASFSLFSFCNQYKPGLCSESARLCYKMHDKWDKQHTLILSSSWSIGHCMDSWIPVCSESRQPQHAWGLILEVEPLNLYILPVCNCQVSPCQAGSALRSIQRPTNPVINCRKSLQGVCAPMLRNTARSSADCDTSMLFPCAECHDNMYDFENMQPLERRNLNSGEFFKGSHTLSQS